MVIRSQENLIGAWAFLIGVVLAVIVGLVASSLIGPLLLGILAVFGLIVGYFVAEKDVQTFLLASVSLVIVSYTGISGLVLGSNISGINLGKMQQLSSH
jgi:hypothetical protein